MRSGSQDGKCLERSPLLYLATFHLVTLSHLVPPSLPGRHAVQVFEYIMQSLANYRQMHMRMQQLAQDGVLDGAAEVGGIWGVGWTGVGWGGGVFRGSRSRACWNVCAGLAKRSSQLDSRGSPAYKAQCSGLASWQGAGRPLGQ